MSELRIDAEEFEETAERNKSKIRILELTEETIRKDWVVIVILVVIMKMTEETIRKESSNVYVLPAGL